MLGVETINMLHVPANASGIKSFYCDGFIRFKVSCVVVPDFWVFDELLRNFLAHFPPMEFLSVMATPIDAVKIPKGIHIRFFLAAR